MDDPQAVPLIATNEDFERVFARVKSETSEALTAFEREGKNPVLEDKDRLKDSLRDLRGLIAFKPNSVELELLAGKIAYAVDEREEATEYFEQGLANVFEPIPPGVQPLAAELHHMLSEVKLLAGDVTTADFASKQALAMRPKSASYLTGRAGVLLQLGHKRDAEILLRQSLQLDPNLPRTNQLLTLIHLPEVEAGRKQEKK